MVGMTVKDNFNGYLSKEDIYLYSIKKNLYLEEIENKKTKC